MFEFIKATLQRPNYIAFVVLFLWGLYIAITHHNLVKKLIGMYLVQTSVLFFFVTFSVKPGATVPILHVHDRQGSSRSLCESAAARLDVDRDRGPGGHAGSLTRVGHRYLSKV